MKSKLYLLVSLLFFLTINSFGQEVDIEHGQHSDTLNQFNSCSQLQQALDNGSYSFPSSWSSIKCTDKNGTTTVNYIIVNESVKKVNKKIIMKNNKAQITQTVNLTGSNGGTPKVWTDKKYKNCKAWQAAVNNGTYNAPRGYKNITCTDASIAGGGVSLSGFSISIDKKNVKMNKHKTHMKLKQN